MKSNTSNNFRIPWAIFIGLSIISLILWYRFSYPQLSFINFSVDRHQALSISKNYLLNNGHDISTYKTAVVFGLDEHTNRYLQKSVGIEELKKFIKVHDFDMFFWIVRFFKQGQKEGFLVTVSCASGEIISFKHIIPDTAARETLEREDAKEKGLAFLSKMFGTNFDDYILKGDLKHVYDHRSDFSFTWRKNDVNVPWNEDETSGTGKLVTGVTISGEEILSFSKNTFQVPEDFSRDLSSQKNVGKNLSTAVTILYYILYISSIFFIIVRRNHLVMHTTKRFYIGIAVFVFLLSVLSRINSLEIILFEYQTTDPLKDYLWRFVIYASKNILFFSVAILMPCFSGELLHYEQFKHKPRGSFLHYIRTSFCTREVALSICLGYFVCMIMLGLQSCLIKFGQKFLGVWVEHSWMNNLSTTYFPFLAALILGFKASFFEEIMYRLFAISWLKKVLNNTLAAVLVSSLIWGFAHSLYPIFPMWFRGIEVSILGIFLATIYLRFGLIPVLVAHFLFDAFWSSSGYLLGQSSPFYFLTCLLVLLLPLIWGIIAFILNRTAAEHPMRWKLSKHQQFNLEVLKSYLTLHPELLHDRNEDNVKKEVASHGWDIAVVEVALDELKHSQSS